MIVQFVLQCNSNLKPSHVRHHPFKVMHGWRGLRCANGSASCWRCLECVRSPTKQLAVLIYVDIMLGIILIYISSKLHKTPLWRANKNQQGLLSRVCCRQCRCRWKSFMDMTIWNLSVSEWRCNQVWSEVDTWINIYIYIYIYGMMHAWVQSKRHLNVTLVKALPSWCPCRLPKPEGKAGPFSWRTLTHKSYIYIYAWLSYKYYMCISHAVNLDCVCIVFASQFPIVQPHVDYSQDTSWDFSWLSNISAACLADIYYINKIIYKEVYDIIYNYILIFLGSDQHNLYVYWWLVDIASDSWTKNHTFKNMALVGFFATSSAKLRPAIWAQAATPSARVPQLQERDGKLVILPSPGIAHKCCMDRNLAKFNPKWLNSGIKAFHFDQVLYLTFQATEDYNKCCVEKLSVNGFSWYCCQIMTQGLLNSVVAQKHQWIRPLPHAKAKKDANMSTTLRTVLQDSCAFLGTIPKKSQKMSRPKCAYFGVNFERNFYVKIT